MKTSAAIAGAVGACMVAASPFEKRQDSNIDITVLQFALTLEHLENAFYVGALNKLSQSDFAAAGYDATYYEDLRRIAEDEQSHVALLTSAVSATGVLPVSPCEYSFPYTDVKSFISLSSVLEGVGTSAYLGGAPLITSKDYLTVAGSILVTEALHTSYQRANVPEVPFANPYGTPLDPTSVFTLASAFIVSCPAQNPALPFVPYPALAFNTTETCGKATSYRRSKRSLACRSRIPGNDSGSKGGKVDGGDNGYNNGGKDNGNNGYNGDGHSNNGTTANPMPNPAMCERVAGDNAVFTANATIPTGAYLTFVSGLDVASVQGTITGMNIAAQIPAIAAGQTYVLITSAAATGGKVDATTVIAGPAILEVSPPAPQVDLSI